MVYKLYYDAKKVAFDAGNTNIGASFVHNQLGAPMQPLAVNKQLYLESRDLYLARTHFTFSDITLLCKFLTAIGLPASL
jgi:hypothetical protein